MQKARGGVMHGDLLLVGLHGGEGGGGHGYV